MRTVIALSVWIAYLIVFNVYIFTYGCYGNAYSKLLYMLAGFITLVYCSFDLLRGLRSDLHRCFLVLCLSSIAANFLLMAIFVGIGNDNYKFKFCTFNGIELITACFVLISGNNRGLFKNERTLP